MADVISHVVVRSTDIKRSEKFYDTVLRFLGFEKIGSDESYAAYNHGKFSFWVLKCGSRFKKDRFARMRVGYDHVALSAKSRGQVDKMQSLLKREGFKILYPAQEHLEFAPGYYSVSFYDPDGIIIELVYLP